MKIAVIGSGFFGSIISLVLSKSHKVHLFEKEKDILNGASKINQFRFHLGFHYPRSPDTIREIKSSEKEDKKKILATETVKIKTEEKKPN